MGLSDSKLISTWEDFISIHKIYYHKTELDDWEVMDLFDKTIDAFQEKRGYSEKTIERLYGYLSDYVHDQWFKQYFGVGGFIWKEDQPSEVSET